MQFRAIFVIGTLLLGLTFPVVPTAMGAQVAKMVECEDSPFSGSWVSRDAKEPFLSKLQVTEVCKQIITMPVAANNPWAGDLGHKKSYIYREYTIRPSTTCSPIDCVWGHSKGKLGEKGLLKAHYQMFWSKRFIKLARENNGLRVHWRIQYIGRKKPDQLGEALLVRAN